MWIPAKTRFRVGRLGLRNLFGFEAVCLVVALLVLNGHLRIRFLDLVMYHFVLWTIWPAFKLRNHGLGSVAAYAVGTAGVALLFILLSPIGFRFYFLPGSLYLNNFYPCSYLHITTSFALSTAQPYWITRLFQVPEPYRNTQLIGRAAL
jgi:hypothetical protein